MDYKESFSATTGMMGGGMGSIREQAPLSLSDRFKRGVQDINTGHKTVDQKYRFCETGYTVSSGSKLWGSLKWRLGMIPSMACMSALLWFWCFVLLPLFVFEFIFCCKFRKNCNFLDFIRLWLGDHRLRLLQYEGKYRSVSDISNWFSPRFLWYQVWNVVIGSAQLVEYILFPYFGHTMYDSFYKYKTLYYESEAFPYLFSVVTSNRDDILNIIHKPAFDETSSPARSKKLKQFDDRRARTYSMFDVGTDLVCYGIPQVFSISDARHEIMRDIQMILLNVDMNSLHAYKSCAFYKKNEEFKDLAAYQQKKYKPFMESLGPDPEMWLDKALSYPTCTKYAKVLHYAPLFYRMFGSQLSETQMEVLNEKLWIIRYLPMPDWFHFMVGNGKFLQDAYILISTVASWIDTGCVNGMTTKLNTYAKDTGIERQAVIYAAATMFLFAEGAQIPEFLMKKFLQNPSQEYANFMKNQDFYILEACRYHAQCVRATSNLSGRKVSFFINGKKQSFPSGTPVAASLLQINDNIPSYTGDEFVPKDTKHYYNQAVSFNVEDRLFLDQESFSSSHDIKLPARFCPGRAISVPHLKQVIYLLFQSLQDQIDEGVIEKGALDRPLTKAEFDYLEEKAVETINSRIDATEVEKIHSNLSAVNQLLVKSLIPEIDKISKDERYMQLPAIEEVHESGPVMSAMSSIAQFATKDDIETSEIFGITLLKKDEYYDRNFSKDAGFLVVTHGPASWISAITGKDGVPAFDDPTLFGNNLETSKKLMNDYVSVKFGDALPAKNTVWTDLKSNYAASLFAFSGIVCNYTRVVTQQDRDTSVSAGSNNIIPEAAVYKCDTTPVAAYKVREGLHCYGACAYFDEDYRLVSVFVCHSNKMVYVGTDLKATKGGNYAEIDSDMSYDSKELIYAKYVWTTSLIASLTLVEHALFAHLKESAQFVRAVYQELPLDHWLRKLCHIFTYRTVYINESLRQVLLPQNGLVHRIWGFEYSSIEQLAADTYAQYRFEPFVERFDQEMCDVPDEVFPLNKDSNEFYDAVYYFVSEYIKIYFDEGDKISARFYDTMCEYLDISQDTDEYFGSYSYENLCKLIANMVCVVTAYHERVGGVMDIVGVELDWHDTKLYKKKALYTCQSKNDFVLASLLVMITGVRNPRIINQSLLNAFDDQDSQYPRVLEIFNEWQARLEKLSRDIDERNEKRRIPFNSCNPKNIECSLSI